MFCLSLVEHNLPVPPHLLNLPLIDAIKQELEKLFLDKVITDLGLCVSVYDVRSVEGGFIVPGEGHSTYKVEFRLLMFRPFPGEILTGKIEESNSNGLRISLGFFNDIYVPEHFLQQPCTLGEDDIWIWTPTEESDPLSLDVDEEIRFRVINIKYPPIIVEQEENAKPFAPMVITGSIDGAGLGLVSWWDE